MSDLMFGLLGWLLVAVVVGVLIGRYMRIPSEQEPPSESVRTSTKLVVLPAYGEDDANAKSSNDAR